MVVDMDVVVSVSVVKSVMDTVVPLMTVAVVVTG